MIDAQHNHGGGRGQVLEGRWSRRELARLRGTADPEIDRVVAAYHRQHPELTDPRDLVRSMIQELSQAKRDPERFTIVRVSAPDPDRSLLKDLGEPGLDLLRTARGLLSQAAAAPAPLRAELTLGASIALSAYEQDRVQPSLEFVFYRPIRWLLQVTWRLPWYYLTGTSGDRERIYRRPHERQPRIMRAIEDRWVRMYSRTLWLKTAVDTIMLSQPLTLPRGVSPAMLRPAATFRTREVADLVARYGPPDPGALKGVANWLDYGERMRFIVAYFMGYQQVPQMFDQPRYKRTRSWRKPPATEPLGRLEFRTVPL